MAVVIMTYLDKMDIALVEVIKEYLKSLGVDIFELEDIDITTNYTAGTVIECAWVQIQEVEFFVSEATVYNEEKNFSLKTSFGSGEWDYEELAAINIGRQQYIVFREKKEK